MTTLRLAATPRFAAFAFAVVMTMGIFSSVAGLSAPVHGAAVLAQTTAAASAQA